MRSWSPDVRMSGGETQLAELRRELVGVVFQRFKLLPALSVLQNVLLPLRLPVVRWALPRGAKPRTSRAWRPTRPSVPPSVDQSDLAGFKVGGWLARAKGTMTIRSRNRVQANATEGRGSDLT